MGKRCTTSNHGLSQKFEFMVLLVDTCENDFYTNIYQKT